MKITNKRNGNVLDVADWFGKRKIESGRYESSGQSAPNKSDVKSDWVDYAVASGMDRDEANEATKDDLIDRFGS